MANKYKKTSDSWVWKQADENTSTSSHHDNINRQAPENQENEQSNTLRHCADIMAARETSDNWMWKHVLKLDDDTIQCNVDNCDKIYKGISGKFKYWIKIHLYHTHKIWAEEDRLKWENDNDPIWQYFDKIDLYKGKCKFCKNFYREAYLKKHLQSVHSQELRADVQKEIAIKSQSQSFKIDEKECSIRCKRCNHKMEIFDTDILTYHTCSNNYVNRMTQQFTATENANTSSYHDDINNQPQSRENHQRSISNKPRFPEGIADNNMYKITPQFIAVENMTASNYDYENTNCQNPRIQEVEQSFEDIIRDGMIPSVTDENAGINSYYAYTNWQAFHNQD